MAASSAECAFAAPDISELAPLFPHLDIVELIGTGGMGAVYKARQIALDRFVALKILPKELGVDAPFAERFAKEACALARLSHPGIVTIYDSGTVGGFPYLILEYVEGRNLRHAIVERSIPAPAALRLVTRLCDALQYAREHGVIHRDIKPENILVAPNGEVKLADFGLAKLLGAGGSELTQARQIMGTRHYMAPEQEETPASVDHRADIYSLGVVSYELLTGELPRGQFDAPSRKVPVNSQIDAVVLKAMAREPGRRFQDAEEMKTAITSALQRRRANVWLWIAAVAAAATVLFAFFVRRSASNPVSEALRWGGDASGGAPYIIEGTSKQQPTGFEAELAEYLAGKLGVRPQFVPRSWESLPQDLARGSDIDIILNGYEWFPERELTMASTIPYYICKIQMVVRRDSPIHDWTDLHRTRSGKQLRIGVLSESAAHRYLKNNFTDDEVRIVDLSDEGITGVLTMIRQEKLDATVIDVPAALWYVEQKHGYEDLEIRGQPIEPTYYVIYCRPGDTALRDSLNAALRQAYREGAWKTILDKYGLWNDDQNELTKLSEHWPPQSEGSAPPFSDHVWLLLRAAGVTLVLACLSMPCAMALGLLVAVGRLYGPRWLSYLLTFYVELLRGTPLLMQLLVIYYVVPLVMEQLGLPKNVLNEFWSGMLALAINYSAYEAENYRAGILAIPRGQMEAALALGMSKATALRRVIVPQAVRIVIPPVTNDFIALFKDTSICSVIAVHELAWAYKSLMVNFPRLVLELGTMTAVLYLTMSWPLSLLARRLERRFATTRG
jgi:polar amino acid transport system substrate-binding protein